MSTSDSLIHRYLDDRSGLEAEELDELIALLKAEPARAVALREQLLLDDLVAQKLSVDRRNFPAQVEQRIADFHRGQQEMDDQVADLRALAESEFERPTTWSGSSPWVKYIALAATVLIAAVIFVPRFLPKAPQAVAKVTAVQGEVQVAGGKAAAAVGLALLTGQEIVTPAGTSLSLAFADKTTIEIAGESTVAIDLDEVTGGKKIRLDRGEIVASVSKQDPVGPMRLTTPHAVATVMGTQFRLTVTGDATLLDVTEGVVLLNRLNDAQPITVTANETGIASGELLQGHPMAWPEDRQSVAYLFSPFDFLPALAPVMICRNPETGNLRDTPLEPIGDATLNEFTAAAELHGGFLKSDEAGTDLWHVLADHSKLTVEIVLSAPQGKPAGDARIVALADDGQSANFALLSDGDDLVFQLRTAGEPMPLALRFHAGSDKGPMHIAVTYRDGELVAYRDGMPVAKSEAFHGPLVWREGPLTLGADASGDSPWQGTVEALAIHGRWLDGQEIARNARNFRLLAKPHKK